MRTCQRHESAQLDISQASAGYPALTYTWNCTVPCVHVTHRRPSAYSPLAWCHRRNSNTATATDKGQCAMHVAKFSMSVQGHASKAVC
jgi:hypothetical protein